jgi:hypothetical protein
MSLLSLFPGNSFSSKNTYHRKHRNKSLRIKRTGPPAVKNKDAVNFPILIPKISIHPDKINLYSEVAWSKVSPCRKKYEHLLTSDKQHNGKVSKIARQKSKQGSQLSTFHGK